jgi:probable HAF family extracellular repeat protein
MRNVSISVACAVLVAIGRASAAVYIPIDLGTLGGHWTAVTAISRTGQVVGVADTPSRVGHAFRWTVTGGIQDLGTLPRRDSYAVAINDSGQVLVNLEHNTIADSAFLWTPAGGLQRLGGIPGADWSEGTAINNAGQIVGFSSSHAFLWTAESGMRDLGALDGDYSSASVINDAGQVAGVVQAPSGQFHLFIWTVASGMRDVGSLNDSPGLPSLQVIAINRAGWVVGEAAVADYQYHAFVWTPKRGMQDLGTLGGDSSFATGINDAGEVIGISSTADGHYRGFLWAAALGMQDLGAIGGISSSANAINSSGLIVGTSSPGYATLWTAPGVMQNLGPAFGEPGYSFATAINDAGSIIGQYDSDVDPGRAVLWRTLPQFAADFEALLAAQVASGAIAPQLQRNLQKKLDAVAAALESGDPNAARTAANNLGAVVNEIRAQKSKKITQAAAGALLSAAQPLIQALNR